MPLDEIDDVTIHAPALNGEPGQTLCEQGGADFSDAETIAIAQPGSGLVWVSCTDCKEWMHA